MTATYRDRSGKRLDDLEQTSEIVTKYHALEQSRVQLYRRYMYAFGGLLQGTMLLTLVLGILLARGVTKRMSRLSAAINLVAAGEMGVRVPVKGNDELSDLARAFNGMISEMAESRARIEFLQRIGAWQEMAQRTGPRDQKPPHADSARGAKSPATGSTWGTTRASARSSIRRSRSSRRRWGRCAGSWATSRTSRVCPTPSFTKPR